MARNDFYSEYPTLRDIEESFEYNGPRGMDAPDPVFDDADVYNRAIIAEFARSLVPFTDAFDPPVLEQETGGFFWKNTQFSSLDAMAYFSILSSRTPTKLIEIGSGNSTFVAAQAISGLDKKPQVICIDPVPRREISELTDISLIQKPLQDVSVEEIFGDLTAGDIVFYDGSHTLKTGSDTVFFYLKILPYLPKGVLVHAHDVSLPWPRKAKGIIEAKLSWSEQYILAAHLLNTTRYRVLFGSGLVAHDLQDIAKDMLRGRYPVYGGSLWFEVL